MGSPGDRRLSPVLIGGAAALAAGLGIGLVLIAKHKDETPAPPPASQGGLVIDASGAEDGKLDPAKPLRCFVAGAYVGELTLADCAKRNGVATGALDVGVDETGALAAAGEAGTVLTPLPPPSEAVAPPMAAVIPMGVCWRYADAEWRKSPGEVTLNACVQALFAGRCERPGSATYGRWAQQTLRLVPGKVEISSDNRSFRTFVEQGAGCAIPAVG